MPADGGHGPAERGVVGRQLPPYRFAEVAGVEPAVETGPVCPDVGV
ncbi:hypothetical protein [Sphingomonas hankookensis]